MKKFIARLLIALLAVNPALADVQIAPVVVSPTIIGGALSGTSIGGVTASSVGPTLTGQACVSTSTTACSWTSIGTVSGVADSFSTITGNATDNASLAAALNAKLTAASNLSDIASAAVARTNLGLGSAATHPASDFLGATSAAVTANALSTTPATCSAGNYARGIDAAGSAVGCTAATGAGTVTSASVVTANGLAGTVANPTTTPAITLATTITGLLKGSASAIVAATSGTDYVTPSGSVDSAINITSGVLGSVPYQSASGVTSFVPANTSTDVRFLSQTGNGTNSAAPSWQTLPVQGNLTYFMTGTASTPPAGYLAATAAAAAASSVAVTPGANGTDVVFANFITASGVPNTLTIPAGLHQIMIHADKSTTSNRVLTIKAELWEVNASGTDLNGAPIIIYGSTPAIDTTIGANPTFEYNLTYQSTVPITLASTASRLVVRMYYTMSGSGTIPTLTVRLGGNNDTHIAEPSVSLDVSNFPPYTGAITDLNLDGHDLIATKAHIGTAVDITHMLDVKLPADNNIVIDGRTNPRAMTQGSFRINQTPSITGTRAINVDLDMNGLGDTHAFNIDSKLTGLASGIYTNNMQTNFDTANSTGGTADAFDVSKTGTGTADVWAMHVNGGVGVLRQTQGDTSAIESAFTFSGSFTDTTSAFASSGVNVTLFNTNSDYVYVGMAATYSSIAVTLATPASTSVLPVFQYSNGAGGWVTFSPADNTNGFTGNGNITWVISSLTGWAQDTVNAVSGKYWVRIQRTKASVTTKPIESVVKVQQGNAYQWDKNGAIAALSYNGNTLTTGTGTLTLGAGKTFTASNTLTLTGTDGTSHALPNAVGGTLLTSSGVVNTVTQQGDQFKLSTDLSVFRTGSLKGTLGDVFTSFGQEIMHWMTHNFAISSTGVFAGRDEAMPAQAWTWGEDGSNTRWDAVTGAAGSAPVFTKTMETSASGVEIANAFMSVASGNASSSVTAYPLSSSNAFTVTSTSGVPITGATVTGCTPSHLNSFQVIVTASSVGATSTFAHPTGTVWPAGTAPTMTTTANKRDLLFYQSTDCSVWFGSVLGQNY